MKPRFKLRLDGSMLIVRSRLDEALVKVAQASDAPILFGVRGLSGRLMVSDAPEARYRRKIIRAFGSVAAFTQFSGLCPQNVTELLKVNYYLKPTNKGAKLKLRCGLPVRLSNGEVL